MSKPGSKPVQLALVAALVGVSVVFVVAAVAGRTQDRSALWLNMGVYNAAFVLAGILALIRARAGEWRTHPWALIGSGLLIYALGGVLHSYGIGGSSNGGVAVADGLWLLFYPLAFLGLLGLVRRRLSLELQHGWLDALFLGLGLFSFGLAVLDDTFLADLVVVEPGAAYVNAMYVIGDLVLLCLVVATLYAFEGRPPRAWWLLLGALVAFAATDALYLYREALGVYVEGERLDAGWVVAALLFGLAAYSDVSPIPALRRLSAVAAIVPMALIVLVGWVLTWPPVGPLQAMVVLTAFATLVMAAVRLALAVRDARVLAEQLRQSRMDTLTGLMNRQGLQSQNPTAAGNGALVLIDLYKFRDINVSLGHDVGDRLLCLVAAQMSATMREKQRLARVDGDAFAAYLPDADADTAVAVAGRLVTALKGPHSVDGMDVRLTACAGVALSTDAAQDLQTMFKEAETALERAKADGPGLVRVHQDGNIIASEGRIRMRADIGASLDAGGEDFELHYQPIVEVATGRVYAFEVLVRYRHDGELLPPGRFLDDVVRSGNMLRLTATIMRKGLGEFRAARLPYPITVNVSPEHVDASLVQLALDSLAATGSDPSQLIIEITEDALLRDPAAARPVVAELRDHGVRVLMDDFGTGWSGLSSVRDLVVDGLKLDHSFVSTMARDETAMAVVRSVSSLASDLSLLVIFEGAEDEAEMQLLRTQGVGYVQGYGVARPAAMDQTLTWIEHTQGLRT
jgi:diguanylate cyclase (GGDEF)-like protein